MRTPYPRPRGVKARGSFMVVSPLGPRPSEPPQITAPTSTTPVYRFELARGSEDIYSNQRDWTGEVQMTVKAENQKAAFEKAGELSGRPVNQRYMYIFRVKSVSEL